MKDEEENKKEDWTKRVMKCFDSSSSSSTSEEKPKVKKGNKKKEKKETKDKKAGFLGKEAPSSLVKTMVLVFWGRMCFQHLLDNPCKDDSFIKAIQV